MENIEKRDIIVLGGGGHAKVVTSTLQKNPIYNVIGFLDDNTSSQELLKTPRLDNLLPASDNLRKSSMAIGIGHIGNTKLREKIINEYEEKGHTMESVISPTAIINPDVVLGKGVVVFDGAILQPGVKIGDYSIVNTRASIDHDCHIGKHVHIAPGVTLSGNVHVGDRVLVGTGASIIQGITIADDCIIGAGAVVIHNCDKIGGVYVGSPARLIKNNNS